MVILIDRDTDCHASPKLIDSSTGQLVRFEPHHVVGGGWTVAKIIGSRKTGRLIEIVGDFEGCSYTLAQAQVAAENHTHDVFRNLQSRV